METLNSINKIHLKEDPFYAISKDDIVAVNERHIVTKNLNHYKKVIIKSKIDDLTIKEIVLNDNIKDVEELTIGYGIDDIHFDLDVKLNTKVLEICTAIKDDVHILEIVKEHFPKLEILYLNYNPVVFYRAQYSNFIICYPDEGVHYLDDDEWYPELKKWININSYVKRDEIKCIDKIYYQVSYDFVKLLKCPTNLEKVIVPSDINGIPLKIIGAGAFKDFKGSEIILPEGIEEIEVQAFRNIKNIKQIIIPHSIKEMGSKVFEDTFNTKIYVLGTKAEHKWRKRWNPEKCLVEYISNTSDISKLKEKRITKEQTNKFSKDELEHLNNIVVNLPNKYENEERPSPQVKGSFEYRYQYLGPKKHNPNYNVDSDEKIYYIENDKKIFVELLEYFDNLGVKFSYLIHNFNGHEYITIYKVIAPKNVKHIIIPDEIDAIPVEYLEYISLYYTDRGTFKGSSHITSLTLGNNLKFIYRLKFVPRLEKIYIPRNFNATYFDVLYMFKELKTYDKTIDIIVDKENKKYTSKDGLLYNKDITSLICGFKWGNDLNVIVPNTLSYIVNISNFCDMIPKVNYQLKIDKDTKCIDIKLLDFVNEINVDYDNPYFILRDDILFTKDYRVLIKYFNKNNKKFEIPRSVCAVCPNAFSKTYYLERIVVDHDIDYADISSFTPINKTYFKEVVIKNNAIINYAQKYENTENIKIQSVNKHNILEDKTYGNKCTNDNAKNGLLDLKKEIFAEVPEGFEHLDKIIFSEYLKEIKIPKTLKDFKFRYNYEPKYLTKVDLNDNPIFKIENNILIDAIKKEYLYCLDKETEIITIPEGYDKINDLFFTSCKVREVNLPESLMEISPNVFNKTKVEKIKLGKNVKKINTSYGKVKIEIDKENPYFTEYNNAIYTKDKTLLVYVNYQKTLILSDEITGIYKDDLKGDTIHSSNAGVIILPKKYQSIVGIPEWILSNTNVFSVQFQSDIDDVLFEKCSIIDVIKRINVQKFFKYYYHMLQECRKIYNDGNYEITEISNKEVKVVEKEYDYYVTFEMTKSGIKYKYYDSDGLNEYLNYWHECQIVACVLAIKNYLKNYELSKKVTTNISTAISKISSKTFNSKTFEKAMQIFSSNIIYNIKIFDDEINAKCPGSNDEIYDLKFKLTDKSKLNMTCSCASFQKGYGHCKHIIALIVYLQNKK